MELLSLPDLAASKKTQRDKDWPMLRRLVEVNYLTFRDQATDPRVAFWLLDLRTPALLIEAAARFPGRAREVAARRPLLADALSGNEDGITRGLASEEAAERTADRAYWAGRAGSPSASGARGLTEDLGEAVRDFTMSRRDFEVGGRDFRVGERDYEVGGRDFKVRGTAYGGPVRGFT